MRIQAQGGKEQFKSFGRVLLIEDDPSHAHLIRRYLRDYCDEVVHAELLAAAHAEMAEKQPDLIITDLHVPDAQGPQTVKELLRVRSDIPIIVLTSSTSIQYAVEAMKLGARDFIVKDFGPNFREILALSISRVQAALFIEAERLRILREMQMLRTAIENGVDGIGIFRDNGDLVYCNSPFRDFIAHCQGDAQHLSRIFSEAVVYSDKLQETLEERFKTLSPGAVWNTQIMFQKEGSRSYELTLLIVDFQASDAESAQQAVSREGVLWVRDTTEQQRRERFQRDLISTTTHDLKGPLGAIALSTELLTALVEPGSKASEIVLRVSSAAQGAIHLIDEFLSARRIQECTLIMKPARHNIAETVMQVTDSFEAMVNSKGLSLQVNVPHETIEWKIDALGLSRVLTNLLTNAVKFTPKGGRIDVRVAVIDKELHLTVSDTGTGIEPSDVQRIFERFSRLEKHAQIPGTGLGLFIVKSIVAAHGGRIEVTSQPGKGSAFEIVFPSKLPENEHGELICLELA